MMTGHVKAKGSAPAGASSDYEKLLRKEITSKEYVERTKRRVRNLDVPRRERAVAS
jgi:hypothetical protein